MSKKITTQDNKYDNSSSACNNKLSHC